MLPILLLEIVVLLADTLAADKCIAVVEFVQAVDMDTAADMHMDIAAGNTTNVYIFCHVFATFVISPPYQYHGYAV